MSLSVIQRRIQNVQRATIPAERANFEIAPQAGRVIDPNTGMAAGGGTPVVSTPNPASGAATFSPSRGCGNPAGITSPYVSGKLRQIWFTLRSTETSAFTASFRREEFSLGPVISDLGFLVENQIASTNALLQLLQHNAIVFDRVALIANNTKSRELLSIPIRIYGVYPMNGGNRIFVDEITPYSEQSQFDQNETRLAFPKIWVLDSLTDFQMQIPADTGTRNISFDFVCGIRDIVPNWALGQYLERLNASL